MNIRNFGVAEGRMVRDAKVLPNSDGSKKAFVTLAVQENYKDKNGNRPTYYVSLEGFISKDKQNNGVYDYMKKGALVAVEYTVRSNKYTDKEGKAQYSQVLSIQSVDLKESQETVNARNAAEQQQAPQAQPEMPPMNDTPFN